MQPDGQRDGRSRAADRRAERRGVWGYPAAWPAGAWVVPAFWLVVVLGVWLWRWLRAFG